MFRRKQSLSSLVEKHGDKGLIEAFKSTFPVSVDLQVEGHLFNNYEISMRAVPGVDPISSILQRELQRIDFSVEYIDAPSSMVPMVNFNEDAQDFSSSLWHQYRAPLFIIGASLIATNLCVSIPLTNTLLGYNYHHPIVLTTVANTLSGLVSGIITYYYATRDGRQLMTRKREDLPWEDAREVMRVTKSSQRIIGDSLLKNGLYTGNIWSRKIAAGTLVRDCVPADMTVYALTASDCIIRVGVGLKLNGGETVDMHAQIKSHFAYDPKEDSVTGDIQDGLSSLYLNRGNQKRLVMDSPGLVTHSVKYSNHFSSNGHNS
jgi:hypothetical protein